MGWPRVGITFTRSRPMRCKCPASQWAPVKQSDGSYEFKNRVSGLCLDNYGYTSIAGVQLDQWPCKNASGNNQDFKPE